MATSEQFHLFIQALQNMEGLRNDMRRNAQAYSSDVQSGRLTIAQVQDVARADAGQYQRRLKWMVDIFNNPTRRARLIGGITAIAGDVQELIDAYTQMKAVADQQEVVAWTTSVQIDAAVAALLAAVPAHDRVF